MEVRARPAEAPLPKTILVVEDEKEIRDLLAHCLRKEGFAPILAADGETAISKARKEKPDLVLLDILLPKADGLEVLRGIRSSPGIEGTPVVMLTAKGEETDRVVGLELGADDYITKPFSIEELLARIRLALRKTQADTVQLLSIGPLTMDVARHQVAVNGEEVELTGREFSLLKILMENQSIVLSRETLMEKVWGYDYVGETNIVDVYIRYLRAKVDDRFNLKLIHTVRGVGYTLKTENPA